MVIWERNYEKFEFKIAFRVVTWCLEIKKLKTENFKFFPFSNTKVATLMENAAEKPTYPMYNSGGCTAKAGSCKIGLKPNPFSWTGIILSKGFEVKIVNTMNPKDIRA